MNMIKPYIVPMKKLVIMLLCLFVSGSLIAQGPTGIDLDKESADDESKIKEEVDLSIFVGAPFFGPKKSLVDLMNRNDFNGFTPISVFQTQKYPVTSRLPTFGIALTFYKNNNKGYFIEYKYSNLEIVGVNNLLHESIQLNSIVNSLSLLYNFHFKDKRINLRVGPDLLHHKTRLFEDFAFPYEKEIVSEESKFNVGLKLGGSAKLLNKKHFFMDFKTDYTLAVPIKIDPFRASLGTVIPKSSLSLNTLDIGLSFGYRFH